MIRDKWLHLKRNRIKPLVRKFISLLPVQRNKVVFLNYNAKGYGDNPKYIAEEFLRRGSSTKLVWLVDGNDFVPNKIKAVNVFGIKAFYEISTAKIIISNSKFNIPTYFKSFKKKKSQFYLQTWHGDFALKYIEKEAEDSLSAAYLEKTKADSLMTDAILSGSPQFSQILRESFWLPEHCAILEYGIPRNDLYYSGDGFRESLKQKYGFSQADKILLYAPTFRSTHTTEYYSIDFDRLRDSLYNKTKNNWRVIVRLHPNISNQDSFLNYNENIINGSSFPDQQELCMISDCLITDYSSIMADFMLMKKPIFLFVPDLDNYSNLKTGQGLRDMFYHLPFSFNRNQDELEIMISNFNQDVFDKRTRDFMHEFYTPFFVGHSSKKVVDYLTRVIHA